MATKYARNVTANWNVDSTWSTTGSGGAADTTVPTSADDVIFDSGYTGSVTLTASTTINSLVCQAGATGTLTHNASVTLTIDSQDGAGDSLKFVSGFTYNFTAATSRITFTGIGTNKITCGGITLPNITFNNSGDTFQIQDEFLIGGTSTTALYLQAGIFDANSQAVTLNGTTPTISGAFSFYTLNRTGTAVKTDTLALASNITVTNTLNIDGNSAVNRVLVTSNTLGTPQTLTITGATISGCSNVDFRDITFANGGSNVDFSAITGGSGDCGGNTISGGGTLSFTTADDWYWNGSGTRNFSDYTYWYTATNGGGSQMGATLTPLPQDTCYFDANSIDGATTVDQDMPRIPGIDFTGVGAMAFHINNIDQQCYGSFIKVDNVTITSSSANSFDFLGRATKTVSGSLGSNTCTINLISGSLTAVGNFSARSITISSGTSNADIYNITATLSISISGTGTRTVNMGSGTWQSNQTSNSGDYWTAATTTNLTFDAETSTIVCGAGDAGETYYFRGGNLAYNNLTINGAANTVIIQNSNSFTTFTINTPKTVKFTDGTTQTVTSFVATGDAVNGITLTGTGTGGWTILDSVGTNSTSYCTISYSAATGGATWMASTSDGNVDGGGNTGWIFGTAVTITPSALALTATNIAPVISTFINLLPDAFTLTITDLAPTIVTALDVLITPSVLSLTVTDLISLISTGAGILPSAFTLTIADQTPIISTYVNITPSSLSITASDLTPIITNYETIYPNALNLTIGDLVPIITNYETIYPDALSLIIADQLATISTDVNLSPAALSLTASLLEAIIRGNCSISPATLSIISSLLASTVVQDALISPATLSLIAALLSPTIIPQVGQWRRWVLNPFTNRLDRIGVWGSASDYTITNANDDRAFNADTVTTAELADVVATIIRDLTDAGLLK